MCSDLPSELKGWLQSLGFSKQNGFEVNVENEFQKLTPPEIRDIWRNIMKHVISVEKKRYVQKVLLLNELKKKRLEKNSNPLLAGNLKSVAELETYSYYEKLLQLLNNRKRLIQDIRSKIDELKQNLDKLNEDKKCLLGKKGTQNNVSTLLRLEIKEYEKRNIELGDTRKYLNYANSVWNLSEPKKKLQPTECMLENLMGKVHGFGKRRLTLNDYELRLEQQKLQKDTFASTMSFIPSALQKNVLYLLENALSSLLKLRENIITNRETNSNTVFEWEFSELKKQCVRTYMDNHGLQMKVKTQERNIQEQLSDLILNFEKNCRNDNEKEIVRNWLDMEHLKHRMSSRQKFLLKMENIARSEISNQFNVDFRNAKEKNKFLKRVHDIKNELIALEEEISDNLSYLSDRSINLFVNYQQFCKRKIGNFIQREKKYNTVNSLTELSDLLKTEVNLIENLSFLSANGLHLQDSVYDNIPCNNVVEYARKTNFLLYLENTCNNFFQRVNYSTSTKDVLHQKTIKIKFEENDFVTLSNKLLEKASNNLKLTEKEAEMCSKNMALWTNFSIDELVPEHMTVDKCTFSQWQERYRTCIHSLQK